MITPTKALSIMQPWSWLIVNGHKDIENRTWRHNIRGQIFIHAGLKQCHDVALDLDRREHPLSGERITFEPPIVPYDCGGIVGIAEIVDCVDRSDSPWFVGPFGFVIRNARPLPFTPCRGQLGFFDVDPDLARVAIEGLLA